MAFIQRALPCHHWLARTPVFPRIVYLKSRLHRPPSLRRLAQGPNSSTSQQEVNRPPSFTPSSPELFSRTSEQSTSENSPEQSTTASVAQDQPAAELEEKTKEIADLKDRYLRSVADFRNLQDRARRDIAAARDFAISNFARDLLDSVDNLDRALSMVDVSRLEPTSPENIQKGVSQSSMENDLRNLYDGLRMTERVLVQTLAKHGLERFDPAETGEKFDPNVHDASFMAPVQGKQEGTVFNTIQKGFKLNGRVIRAAKVGVVRN